MDQDPLICCECCFCQVNRRSPGGSVYPGPDGARQEVGVLAVYPRDQGKVVQIIAGAGEAWRGWEG